VCFSSLKCLIWCKLDIVNCTILTDPPNRVINCTMDVNDPSCNFTCNTGYELTGSATRSCQADGSWSGTNASCIIGLSINIPQFFCIITRDLFLCSSVSSANKWRAPLSEHNHYCCV